ncbi:unnamed protein product [Penicillium salamii]|uniref:Uncharacterized protein n=1 Tax=Penicillium salamii TaxID=1612424 RepID=A0A9W4K074_9EURO|nr:unnamed protein product [Penicillium salamii]CAG8125269.1 unnamed protein product [Penicillium salamii]CAG8219484.1 unnamed protein product [Penicillium salamii]CAG8245250.1 unnamed protein product [Penicillium salamii]CAG8286047.1 unnamed protein product [Penicillium salamii]
MASAPASARPQSLSTLLETLTTCLSTTVSSLPKAQNDASNATIEPPQDGISLLDTKSEILLSYLQNLVFLIIFQLRNVSAKQSKDKSASVDNSIEEDIRKKLIELRVYLERGVRPLEGRLKYQVDKVIKAAEEAERAEKIQPTKAKSSRKAAKDSDASSDEDEESSESEGDEDIDEMAYRPNVSAFSKGPAEKKQVKPSKPSEEGPGDGIYRPPRIMPTALPTTERRERQDRRPIRSNVIDDFVNAEMSSAPMAEPSVGSTIIDGGRTTKSRKDQEHEQKRTTYEETNFVRLPKETKKDLAKRGGRKDTTYGGDEWKDLNAGADHIERLTRKTKSNGAALEKSRKRTRNEDGQRGDGVGMGQIFDKRRKKVDSWKR